MPRLKGDLHLLWAQLQEQLGSGEMAVTSLAQLAQRLRDVLPNVLGVYPDAKVEVTRHGLLLRPSLPAVPRAAVLNGFRLVGQ